MTKDDISKNLEYRRHTLAHLLAQAVLEHYPNVFPTLGPAIDNGFYYDFDFGAIKITDEDLVRIEKIMKKNLSKWIEFTRKEVSANEAKEIFNSNIYKNELIDGIVEKGEKITLYICGGFTDLCRGGHIDNPSKEITPDSFKLSHVAGAYWRGDEKNKMLTRIYGFAFESKEELEQYEKMLEEAKARDHRKIGKDLDLFTFSPLVGPGLPLWTPKGSIIREELDKFVWSLRKARGYQKVTIPHITKRNLYDTSGHWEKFANDLFKVNTRENKEYALKPMNCPHHTQIFARHPHSYRDMPQRFAETTMVYRDEQSGELGGLMRVLSITQDDAHVFCRHSQVREEFFTIWDMIDTFYKAFDFKLRVRLSFHNPNTFDKYLGTKEIWKNAEDALREIAIARKADFFEAPGEATMYGPKLDFMAKDSIGREHQVATVQLDMNMPERFDLFCINEKGEHERVVMLHCAIMGSIERFSAVLLEHTAGVLPAWLSPVQVKILPVSGEKHGEFSKEIYEKLKNADIRVELDDSNESLGKRIRGGKMQKIPYLIVIGEKEMTAGTITAEGRNDEKLENLKVEDFINLIKTSR